MDDRDKKLAEMIADLMYTEEPIDRDFRMRLTIALSELRDLRRRWRMFSLCFPWMERFMVWLSRKRAQ